MKLVDKKEEKMKNKDLLYEYWNKTEFGKRIIKSNNVSDSDLLFLIPNNIKKMRGLPLTRISGKKKKKQKKQRKRHIMSFQCFDIIEEMVDELIVSKFSINEFFNEFAEINNFDFGEKVIKQERIVKQL